MLVVEKLTSNFESDQHQLLLAYCEQTDPVVSMHVITSSVRVDSRVYMTIYGCFRKWWYPQIIHFNRVFHYKPSILGYPLFLETPIWLYTYSLKDFTPEAYMRKCVKKGWWCVYGKLAERSDATDNLKRFLPNKFWFPGTMSNSWHFFLKNLASIQTKTKKGKSCLKSSCHDCFWMIHYYNKFQRTIWRWISTCYWTLTFAIFPIFKTAKPNQPSTTCAHWNFNHLRLMDIHQ